MFIRSGQNKSQADYNNTSTVLKRSGFIRGNTEEDDNYKSTSVTKKDIENLKPLDNLFHGSWEKIQNDVAKKNNDIKNQVKSILSPEEYNSLPKQGSYPGQERPQTQSNTFLHALGVESKEETKVRKENEAWAKKHPQAAYKMDKLQLSSIDYSPADAFMLGLGNSATLGLSETLGKKLDPMPNFLPESDPMDKARKQQPLAYGVGEVGGYLVPGSVVEKGAGMALKPVINKVVSNVAKKAITGAVTGGVLSGGESIVRNEPVKDIIKNTAIGTGIGAAGDTALYGLGKGFNLLKDAIRKPIKDTAEGLAETVENIPLEKIVKPKSGTGSYKLKNTEFDNTMNEYNNAIEKIQNHFGTNELRTDEIPLIKSELGIDLDNIISKMEKFENKTLTSPDELKLKRAAGVNSDKSSNVIENVVRQESVHPSMVNSVEKQQILSDRRVKLLQDIVDNPDGRPKDMVERAKNELANAKIEPTTVNDSKINNINDKPTTNQILTKEQSDKLSKLESDYKTQKGYIQKSSTNTEMKNADLKSLLMKYSADKRNIIQGDSLVKVEGGLTDKELSNKITKLKSNYVGKEVIANGQEGKIIKNSYGKVGVEHTDGSVKYYESNQIKPKNDIDAEILAQKQNVPINNTRNEVVESTNKVKQPREEGKSKFAQTVKNADTTDAAYAETIIPPEYKKVEDQATWTKAIDNVKTNSDEVHSRVMGKSEGDSFSHQDTADAMALIDKYSREGNFNLANEVLEKTTLKLTKLGQAIQAAAMWARQTPTGMLKYAESVMQKARRNIAKDNPEIKALIDEIDSLKSKIDNMKAQSSKLKSEAKTATGSKKANLLKEIESLDDNTKINLQLFAEKEAKLPAKYKNIKLTDDDLKHIYNEQSEISKMAEGREKTVRIAKLQAYIGKKVPSTLLGKISTIQTLAQLMNFRTAIRNTGGNAGFMVLEEGSNTLATGFDKLLSKITGQRTKAIGKDVLTAEARGLKKGLTTGVSDALQGIETAGFKSQYELPSQTFKGTFKNTGELLKSKQFGNAIKEGTSALLGSLEKGMNIELKATDRAFYQAGFNRSIAEQMRVNGIKSLDKVTPEMLEMAHLDGLYRTFQDKNFLSQGFSAIKRVLNGGKEFGLGDLILKYPKTPANLLMRGIDYSPIAIVRSGIQFAKIITKVIGDKPITPQLQKKFVEGLARGTIGSGLFFLAGAMHKLGIIQGKSPKDSEAANLLKETGQGQYTFNTSALARWVSSGFNSNAAKPQNGDTSISYDWMQPSALTMSAGSNRDEQLSNKGKINPMNLLGAIVTSLESGIDTMAEQPLLTGISNLFRGYGTVSENIANTFLSTPASFIPTFLNQARQLVDNKSRNINDDGNYGLNKALNLVINKIPGLSEKLPEQITTTGNVKEVYQNGSNKWYNVLFNPAFVSTYKTTDGIQTILDLYEKTGETKQFPRKVKSTLTYNKQKLELTPEQTNDLQEFVGKKTIEKLDKLAKNPDYKNASTERQIAAIGKILDISGKQGKAYITKKLGTKYIRENLK